MRPTGFSRRLIALVLAISVALQPGCVAPPQPTKAQAQAKAPETYKGYETRFQSGLGNVAVVAAAKMPYIAFSGFARSKNEAAGKTAGHTLGDCLSSTGKGGCSGEFCGLAFILMIAVCGVVVTPVAAVVGAVRAPSAEDIGKSEAVMSRSLDAKLIQDELRDRVVADARIAGAKASALPIADTKAAEERPDYTSLAADGVDTVLEVTLTQVFAKPESEGINPPLPLVMKAHIRVVHTRDNSVVLADDFSYHGRRFSYTQWTENNAQKLAEALKTGYATLAQDITDRVFLLYAPESLPQPDTEACGLGPIEPGNGAVASNQPRISWQPFPRPFDSAAGQDQMARIKNLRYELIVGIGDDGETPEIIYRRDALPAPTHQMDIVLKPGTRYFWSARAKFELDGRQRVTEWGRLCPSPSQLVVGGSLYRFYTPKKKPAPGK